MNSNSQNDASINSFHAMKIFFVLGSTVLKFSILLGSHINPKFWSFRIQKVVKCQNNVP